ncbi:MAG: hypothetical protein FJZ38_18240 [Candidatus Rokubacteria bacterium]|nr:hypothetical protein [Candidatus Rokubacteria bacterium]
MLVVGGTLVLGFVMTVRTADIRWLFLSLPFVVMLWVAARFAPTGYRIGPDGVHVERRVGRKVIPYRDIRAVDRVVRSVKGLTFAGSNGLFGRFGSFWSPRLGFYRLFLTNTDAVVWLSTGQGWVALSPDRPEEFCARLAARLPDQNRPPA